MKRPDTTSALQDRRFAERRLYGRVLAVALAVSAAIHALLLLRVEFSVDGLPASEPPLPLIRIVPAMQALEIAVVGGEVAPIEVQIRQREERPELEIPALDLPVSATPGAAAQGANRAGDPRDPALERLRYRMPKIDVWRPSDPPPRSAEQVMEERISSRIAAYNDSLAMEVARRERATDWTVRDGSGGRWGVSGEQVGVLSPGAIHLGDITIPLPIQFTPSPEKREEVAGRVRNWNEIQRQAALVETREIQADRIRAMRERAAAERAARRGMTNDTSSTGGGPPGGNPGGDGGGTTGNGGGGGSTGTGGSPGGAGGGSATDTGTGGGQRRP